MAMKTTDRDGFEIETCTRCGGSGQFSSCATHGTRCFKCNGAGKSHTTRGAAAVDHGLLAAHGGGDDARRGRVTREIDDGDGNAVGAGAGDLDG